MCQHARVYISSTDEDECGEEPEQGCVCELEQRSKDSHDQGNLWMCDPELVEVVYMGNTEVQRSQEDNLLPRVLSQDVKRYHE